MSRRLHIVFLFIVMVCSTNAMSVERDSLRYQYFYLEALRQQEALNFPAAYDLFMHCLDIDDKRPETWYALSSYYMTWQYPEKAYECMQKAVELNPKNSHYQERLAQYYISRTQYRNAIDVYEQIYANNRDRFDVLRSLAALYEQQKDYPQLLKTIAKIEQVEGESEEMTLAKVRVYELSGNNKAARNTLKALCDSHPYDYHYQVMLGNWLEANGEHKDAYKCFTNVLREEPDNADALMSLYDWYNANGKESQATALLKDIIVSPKTDKDTRYALLRNVLTEDIKQRGDSTKVLDLFRRMLTAMPDDEEIALVECFYMQNRQMADSLQEPIIRSLLDLQPDNASIRQYFIQQKWAQEDWREIASQCALATQYNPDRMEFYYFKGLAHFQMNEHDEALTEFRRGLSQIKDDSDPNIVSDFYAMMGDILHEKGQMSQAFEAYDSCLRWKDDNVGALNNYAYYLALEGKDLDKAEKMSHQTILAQPKEGTYLDTYAWILFRQQRYAEAQIYIDQALLCDENPGAANYDHAGDIYIMNGLTDEAIAFWQKAIEAGGDKTFIEEKIKQRRYIPDKDNKPINNQ